MVGKQSGHAVQDREVARKTNLPQRAPLCRAVAQGPREEIPWDALAGMCDDKELQQTAAGFDGGIKCPLEWINLHLARLQEIVVRMGIREGHSSTAERDIVYPEARHKSPGTKSGDIRNASKPDFRCESFQLGLAR